MLSKKSEILKASEIKKKQIAKKYAAIWWLLIHKIYPLQLELENLKSLMESTRYQTIELAKTTILQNPVTTKSSGFSVSKPNFLKITDILQRTDTTNDSIIFEAIIAHDNNPNPLQIATNAADYSNNENNYLKKIIGIETNVITKDDYMKKFVHVTNALTTQLLTPGLSAGYTKESIKKSPLVCAGILKNVSSKIQIAIGGVTMQFKDTAVGTYESTSSTTTWADEPSINIGIITKLTVKDSSTGKDVNTVGGLFPLILSCIVAFNSGLKWFTLESVLTNLGDCNDPDFIKNVMKILMEPTNPSSLLSPLLTYVKQGFRLDHGLIIKTIIDSRLNRMTDMAKISELEQLNNNLNENLNYDISLKRLLQHLCVHFDLFEYLIPMVRETGDLEPLINQLGQVIEKKLSNTINAHETRANVRLTNLTRQISEIELKITNYKKKIEALNKPEPKMKSVVEAAKSQFDNIKSGIEETTAELEDTKTELEKTTAELEELERKSGLSTISEKDSMHIDDILDDGDISYIDDSKYSNVYTGYSNVEVFPHDYVPPITIFDSYYERLAQLMTSGVANLNILKDTVQSIFVQDEMTTSTGGRKIRNTHRRRHKKTNKKSSKRRKSKRRKSRRRKN